LTPSKSVKAQTAANSPVDLPEGSVVIQYENHSAAYSASASPTSTILSLSIHYEDASLTNETKESSAAQHTSKETPSSTETAATSPSLVESQPVMGPEPKPMSHKIKSKL
jgi:hypothetical protein